MLFHAMIATDAPGRQGIYGIGKSNIARTWSSISLIVCETIVTIPVSCGRGLSSENQTLSPFPPEADPPLEETNNSTPKIPRPFVPQSSPTTFFAIPCAFLSAVLDIGCGCHDSR